MGVAGVLSVRQLLIKGNTLLTEMAALLQTKNKRGSVILPFITGNVLESRACQHLIRRGRAWPMQKKLTMDDEKPYQKTANHQQRAI